MADTKVDWGKTALLGGIGGGWLWGRKKKTNGLSTLEPPPYEGQHPFSATDLGLGIDTLEPISKQYAGQISERSRGEGLVGFDPKLSAMKKQNLDADLDYQKKIEGDQLSSKASGQGLRGGIPLTIANQYNANFQRNRKNAMNNIDIADLEANREDRNTATYAQPQLVQEGAGIQQNRANFDLAEYNATQPAYVEDPQSNVLPALISAGATIAGASMGGPAGAAAGGSIANAYNTSMSPGGYPNYYDPFQNDPYASLRASARRY